MPYAQAHEPTRSRRPEPTYLPSSLLPSASRSLRREVGFIIGFWLLYRLLMLASRIFDTGGPEPRWSWGVIIVALVESSAWAAFTPVVFWLAGRWGTETTPRRLQVPAFVLIGIAAAVVLGLGGRESAHRARSSPARCPVPARRPPFWFAFLNALIIYLGVIAAGLARAYSLRYRARREQAAELQRSSPRRASMRCAGNSIRTFSSTRSTPSPRSSSGIRAACGA